MFSVLIRVSAKSIFLNTSLPYFLTVIYTVCMFHERMYCSVDAYFHCVALIYVALHLFLLLYFFIYESLLRTVELLIFTSPIMSYICKPCHCVCDHCRVFLKLRNNKSFLKICVVHCGSDRFKNRGSFQKILQVRGNTHSLSRLSQIWQNFLYVTSDGIFLKVENSVQSFQSLGCIREVTRKFSREQTA